MSIRRYEGGERIINDETLQRIADALGVSFDYLTGIPSSMLNIFNIPPLPPISDDSISVEINEFIRFIETLGYNVWLSGDIHQLRKGEKIAYITQDELKALVRTSRTIVGALVQDLMEDPAHAPDAPAEENPEGK